MNILQVNSSARTSGSHSTGLATDLAQALRDANPLAALTVRDLSVNPHPPLDQAALLALSTPADRRTPEQAARVALDDALIAELMAADMVVLAAPMYNFGISTQLKAWIDAIARAGVTFRYTETGPVGLVTGKTVHVVVTSGGVHQGRPTDTMTPYLRVGLGFLGMTDLHFVHAEGLAMGSEAVTRAIAGAQARIAQLVRLPEPV